MQICDIREGVEAISHAIVISILPLFTMGQDYSQHIWKLTYRNFKLQGDGLSGPLCPNLVLKSVLECG